MLSCLTSPVLSYCSVLFGFWFPTLQEIEVSPWDCVLSQLEVDVSITVCLKSCPGLLLCPRLVAWVEEDRAQVGRPRLEYCVIVLSHHTLEKTSEVSLSQLPS